jgi:predicted nuclease of predicted toxin-antitoxin system
VKLLFDQNLSPRLVQRLADCFPESAHVQSFEMDRVADDKVLAFAESHGFALVSKDSDFFDPALVRGKAAKIVWIRRGNCSTSEIEAILRRHQADIDNLGQAESLFLLMLY